MGRYINKFFAVKLLISLQSVKNTLTQNSTLISSLINPFPHSKSFIFTQISSEFLSVKNLIKSNKNLFYFLFISPQFTLRPPLNSSFTYLKFNIFPISIQVLAPYHLFTPIRIHPDLVKTYIFSL